MAGPKEFVDFKSKRLLAEHRCPVCGSGRVAVDSAEAAEWRNPDDVVAVKFDCGAEFSVERTTSDVVGRIACDGPSMAAANALNDEADQAFEELDHGEELSR